MDTSEGQIKVIIVHPKGYFFLYTWISGIHTLLPAIETTDVIRNTENKQVKRNMGRYFQHNLCCLRHKICANLKLVRTPLNVYFTAFKSGFLSLCTYKLGWMSCLISFERCQSSCEERGTSVHYKKFLSTIGFEPPTPAPFVFQRVPLTPRLPRQLTNWY